MQRLMRIGNASSLFHMFGKVIRKLSWWASNNTTFTLKHGLISSWLQLEYCFIAIRIDAFSLKVDRFGIQVINMYTAVHLKTFCWRWLPLIYIRVTLLLDVLHISLYSDNLYIYVGGSNITLHEMSEHCPYHCCDISLNLKNEEN